MPDPWNVVVLFWFQRYDIFGEQNRTNPSNPTSFVGLGFQLSIIPQRMNAIQYCFLKDFSML